MPISSHHSSTQSHPSLSSLSLPSSSQHSSNNIIKPNLINDTNTFSSLSCINPLTTSSTTTTNSNRIREGDAYWLRVMQTKEIQWRFLNTVALHELNNLERNACSQLEILCSRLDKCAEDVANFTKIMENCREKRARELCNAISVAPLQKLLKSLKQISKVDYIVADNVHALPISNKDDLIYQLTRFESAAKQFRFAANRAGFTQLADVARGIQNVAALVAHHNTSLPQVAQKVSFAADLIDEKRSNIAKNVIETKSVAFALNPNIQE